MKITDYFINHPVSAIILNALIVLVGILCFSNLKVREYPDIKIPTVVVETFYPNASAELVESSVTNILEDELAALEGLDEIRSWSSPNRSRIMLKFLPNISVDRSLIAIKEAIQLARANLPDQIKEPKVERSGRNNGPPFMSVCLQTSSMSFGELTHYVNVSLKNSFRSVMGVSSVQIFGRPYTYKIILDHKKMHNFGVNVDEVYSAIDKSRSSFPAGKYQKKTPVTIQSELESIEDFENILVKKGKYPIFLKSVADIELMEDNSKDRLRINGEPALCVAIHKSKDSNPLEVSDLMHQEVEKLNQSIPENIKMTIGLDQAEFIRSSLKNIKMSIIEAMFFVLIMILLFLGDYKATLVPIITIPISLLGGMIFLSLFGFSINVITLLAMVLAVGLVVDDAIVVLENITRHIEKGESVLKATIKGSQEILFALIAMTLTLVSVYVPIGFIQGVTGQLFIEFAVALAGSVLISGVTAITLSPLMCTSVLKNHKKQNFSKTDLFLGWIIDKYSKLLKRIINYSRSVILFFFLVIILITILFKVMNKETIPREDRGLIGISIPKISGEDIDDIEKNVILVENVMKNIPEAKDILSFTQEWGGFVVIPLKSLDERKLSAEEVINNYRQKLSSFPSFDAWPWSFSSGLPGEGDPEESSELRLMISTADTYQQLFEEASKARDIGEEKNLFRSIYHKLKLDTAGYDILIDKEVAADLAIDNKAFAKAVSIFFSGDDSLKFKKDGILYSITIEGDTKPWSLDEIYINNLKGHRIAVSSFAQLIPKATPKELEHYNQMRATTLATSLTNESNLELEMDKLHKLADETLPKNYKKTWTGIAKNFKEASSATQSLIFLALLFIYAILSVQFQSFFYPIIILFSVPLACLGSLAALYFSDMTLNVYSQVGLITLIGLITKHGILMIDFAIKLEKDGLSEVEAIQKAAILRLRPILMTTGAMLCGALPLIISHSYGFEARKAIGVVLFFGLSFGTIFTLFIMPNLYLSFISIKKKYLR